MWGPETAAPKRPQRTTNAWGLSPLPVDRDGQSPASFQTTPRATDARDLIKTLSTSHGGGGGGNGGGTNNTQHGSSGMTKSQHSAFRMARGGIASL